LTELTSGCQWRSQRTFLSTGFWGKTGPQEK